MIITKNLALTTAMAATLTSLAGCSSSNEWGEDVTADRETAVCVDQNGKRIQDTACGTGNRHGSGLGGGLAGAYWFYMGRNARVPFLGDSVNDPARRFTGSTTPAAGTSYARAPSSANMTRSAAVSRGGFGSSGRGFGGGRS